MRLSLPTTIVMCGLLFALASWISVVGNGTPYANPTLDAQLENSKTAAAILRDGQIRLCQGYDTNAQSQNVVLACGCQGTCGCGMASSPVVTNGFGYGRSVAAPLPSRTLQGVNQFTAGRNGRESNWRDSENVPWEDMAYGEYIGPHRAPPVAEYRLRVNDSLEFVYLRTREMSLLPYRMFVGDTIRIESAIDPSLTQLDLVVRADGMVSLSLIGQVTVAGKTVALLQEELNKRYTKYVKNPAIVVQVVRGETPLEDIINSVDARAGQGGQGRPATVSPDGTIQLPGIGSVPAIGLTLAEMAREVNARYHLRQGGLEVTPILIERAPRFIYVVGEVTTGGRFELVGPTSVMQAIALAGGFGQGGNLRQVIVFRRDQNWRLTATKLDLNGALLGKRPHPSDEIWLRDSDIVLIPKKPIQRLSEAVDLYLQSTLYAIFPQQGVSFGFDNFTTF